MMLVVLVLVFVLVLLFVFVFVFVLVLVMVLVLVLRWCYGGVLSVDVGIIVISLHLHTFISAIADSMSPL